MTRDVGYKYGVVTNTAEYRPHMYCYIAISLSGSESNYGHSARERHCDR